MPVILDNDGRREDVPRPGSCAWHTHTDLGPVWAQTRLMQVSRRSRPVGRRVSQGAKFGGQRAWAGVDDHASAAGLAYRFW